MIKLLTTRHSSCTSCCMKVSSVSHLQNQIANNFSHLACLMHPSINLTINYMVNKTSIPVFYYQLIIRWIFIVLPHWNNSLQVDMSLHSNSLSWFHANQSLLLLLRREAANTNMIVFCLPQPGLKPLSTALDASMLTITSLMQFDGVKG